MIGRTPTCLAIATLAMSLAVVPAMAAPAPTIGTGARTCTLTAGADCHGVVHRWGVEHHGDLRKVNLRKADLRGADLRGADLRGADLRGAILRHADLRDARLRGASVGPAKLRWAHPMSVLVCPDHLCHAADFRFANLTGADIAAGSFEFASFYGAVLRGVNATGANFNGADLSFADVLGANFTGANLTGTNFTGASPGTPDVGVVDPQK